MRRRADVVCHEPHLQVQWPTPGSSSIYVQLRVMPPTVPPHLSPSQSEDLRACPFSLRPEHHSVSGIVSVVVVKNFGRTMVVDVVLMVVEVVVTGGPHLRSTQVSPVRQISCVREVCLIMHLEPS
jgi:hypothetical protein